MTPGEFRLRVAHRKSGRLRWLSHLELVRTVERCIRRARLPYAVTQGFSPHMKIAFGPALPVGTGSENEYFDVWLTMYTDAEDARARLAAAAPADLAPVAVRYVGDREPSLTAALTIATYRVEIGGSGTDPQTAREAIRQLIARGELTIEHKGKTKVFDLARSLPKEPRVSDTQDGAEIDLAVRMGPQGSLRPELFVRAAFELAGIDSPTVRTTRSDLYSEDEPGVWSRPV